MLKSQEVALLLADSWYDFFMSEFEESPETEDVDLSTQEWTERFKEALIYEKKALVQARPAVPGEFDHDDVS